MIPGSFFNETGLRLAVDAAIERLESAYARPAHGAAEAEFAAATQPPSPMAAA
jgi:hypothetical protein